VKEVNKLTGAREKEQTGFLEILVLPCFVDAVALIGYTFWSCLLPGQFILPFVIVIFPFNPISRSFHSGSLFLPRK
jgi:hypothetical protein